MFSATACDDRGNGWNYPKLISLKLKNKLDFSRRICLSTMYLTGAEPSALSVRTCEQHAGKSAPETRTEVRPLHVCSWFHSSADPKPASALWLMPRRPVSAWQHIRLPVCPSVCVPGSVSEHPCQGGAHVLLAWKKQRLAPSDLAWCPHWRPKRGHRVTGGRGVHREALGAVRR